MKKPVRKFLFPGIVLCIYGVLMIVLPEKGILALKSSLKVLSHLVFPLCLVFLLMLALNLFLKPVHITRLLGRGASLKGILLAVSMGILSTGPIYAWYPLLRDVKEKGAGDTVIAVFLGNRAVKPFLIPVMVSYFGWVYVGALTGLMILGSLALGYALGVLTGERR